MDLAYVYCVLHVDDIWLKAKYENLIYKLNSMITEIQLNVKYYNEFNIEQMGSMPLFVKQEELRVAC